jgi:hypothetical protein
VDEPHRHDLDDWNPDDPDVESVFYDLSAWSIQAQAEVSAHFAGLEIRHAWRGFELVVPAVLETEADAAFEELERRLGLGDSVSVPAAFVDGEAVLEYDLDTWSPGERATLTTALVDAQVPFRWEGDLLVVPAAAEEAVDEILDAVESGDMALLDADGESGAELGELFLLARRLAKEPQDAGAIAELRSAVAVLDPERPPFGVQLGVWRRVVSLCDQMAALAGGTGEEEIEVVDRAEKLHALLRPLV